jgi:hypothetical protein
MRERGSGAGPGGEQHRPPEMSRHVNLHLSLLRLLRAPTLTTAATAPQSEIPIHGDGLNMAASDVATNVPLTSSHTPTLLRRRNPSSGAEFDVSFFPPRKKVGCREIEPWREGCGHEGLGAVGSLAR